MSSATGDLIVVALAGVQRFIQDSRTTADLYAASGIMAELARLAAKECAAHDGVVMVFPEHTGQTGHTGQTEEVRGAPNRVVALAPEGTGPQVAEATAEAVRKAWASWVTETFGERDGRAPDTPGMPDVTWVSVPSAKGDYAARWKLAQRALAARRGVRDFTPVNEAKRKLCSLSPHWVASPPPPKARRHHRDERLSRANWVKRQWDRLSENSDVPRFASTYAISSAAFRRAVADHLDDPEISGAVEALRRATTTLPRTRETPVPGLVTQRAGPLATWLADSAGAWVYPDRWNVRTLKDDFAADGIERTDSELAEVARRGRGAAQTLIERMAAPPRKVPGPAIYLAVIAQDLDGMGTFLSGEGPARNGRPITVTAAEHREVSKRLLTLGADQVKGLSTRELLGVPVYAGGDDLLLFAPAATALAVAERAYGLVPDSLPTASTAVLFFHQHASLRQAITEVQALLKQAKRNVPRKHALAVGYLRRSGVRAASIQPWRPSMADGTSARSFELLGVGGEHTLSPRLVTDLERDADELRTLPDAIYAAELRRLVDRHTEGERGDTRREQVTRVAQALVDLGVREQAEPQPDPPLPRPVHVARVGVFLRQEGR